MKTKRIISILIVVVLLTTLFLGITVSQAANIEVTTSLTQTVEGKEISGYTDENKNAVYTTVIDKDDVIIYEVTTKNSDAITNVSITSDLPNYTQFLSGYTPTSTLSTNGSEPTSSVNGVIENNKVTFKLTSMPKGSVFKAQFKVKVIETADKTLKTFDCVAKISADNLPVSDTNKTINSIYPTTAWSATIKVER